MIYDTIVVGAGIAGLTSAAYLSKAGCKVLLVERADKVGGLINSFEYKGFVFDSGIRAIENSGIVMPMLKQLGIQVPFVKSEVTIGIEDSIIGLNSESSLKDYEKLLVSKFPEHEEEIGRVVKEIAYVMSIMDILYGIDNPLFRNLQEDREYLFKTVLPWLLKYHWNINKALKINAPIQEHLGKFTGNPSIIDMIAQHFFKNTPAFFALSYFSLYLDYNYPVGGTGSLVKAMESYIRAHGGEILTDTEILLVDSSQKVLQSSDGKVLNYKNLIWAADLKRFYSILEYKGLDEPGAVKSVQRMKDAVKDKVGGDSIFTTYLAVDLPGRYFQGICRAHCFYTPHKEGLHKVVKEELIEKGTGFTKDKDALFKWFRRYFQATTYEISCPVLRDSKLAPEGKTGLIVSTLMDYDLMKHLEGMGWYEEFKRFAEGEIVDVLDGSLFKGIRGRVLDQFSSTPLTIERFTGNSEGAITGWAFTNSEIPVENRFKKINQSIFTPVPHVYQAGQWTFSPSGLPVSILTGKLAADEVKKDLAIKG